MSRHRVLLIRPWDLPDGAGAGCCGGGSTMGVCVDPAHHPGRGSTASGERGSAWSSFAQVYLALRNHLPDEVAIEVIDPRNHGYLLPVLTRAARRRGMGWARAIRSAINGPGYAAIIVDGTPVSSGELPSPGEAQRIVSEALGPEVTSGAG